MKLTADQFKVFLDNGYVTVDGVKITELPNNLIVRDTLDLRNTKITKLPDNLTVEGSLNLDDTKIKNVLYSQESVGDYSCKPIFLFYQGEPHVLLGCFKGNQEKAIQAIRKKYGNGSEYEKVVRDGFKKLHIDKMTDKIVSGIRKCFCNYRWR